MNQYFCDIRRILSNNNTNNSNRHRLNRSMSYFLLVVTIVYHMISANEVIASSSSSPLSSSATYINIRPRRSLHYQNLESDVKFTNDDNNDKHLSGKQLRDPSSNYNPDRVPSLEDLFQVPTYWDNSNHSSPCQYHGKKRNASCHLRMLFDREGYEKSLMETKKLILSRLNLKEEPTINVNKNTLEFIEDIKNRMSDEFVDESSEDENFMVKSKYDMKNTLNEHKIINSMQDVDEVSTCSDKLAHMFHLDKARMSGGGGGSLSDLDVMMSKSSPASNSICMKFKLPVKNFIRRENDKSSIRKIQSIVLWLFSHPKSTTAPSAARNDDSYEDSSAQEANDNTITLKIVNLNSVYATSHSVELNRLADGWKTFDLTSLLRSTVIKSLNTNLKHHRNNPNSFIELSLMIKSANNFTIGLFDSNNSEQADDYEASSAAAASSQEQSQNNNNKDLLIASSSPKKPLLAINIYETISIHDELPPSSHHANSKRLKRRSLNHNNNHHHNSNNNNNNNKDQNSDHYLNYRVNGFDKNTAKHCHNHHPDSKSECCLVTYYVNFNALKWSSWIISPSGFFANYCAGKCNDARSFKYAGQNSEIKLKYNENLLAKDQVDTNEILETCCHPISMDSLVIKYLDVNGSIVSTVMPNMVITGCGCS